MTFTAFDPDEFLGDVVRFGPLPWGVVPAERAREPRPLFGEGIPDFSFSPGLVVLPPAALRGADVGRAAVGATRGTMGFAGRPILSTAVTGAAAFRIIVAVGSRGLGLGAPFPGREVFVLGEGRVGETVGMCLGPAPFAGREFLVMNEGRIGEAAGTSLVRTGDFVTVATRGPTEDVGRVGLFRGIP